MPDFDPLDYTNERPFLLLPVGYPAADARVPRLARKPVDEIPGWNRPGPTVGAPGARHATDR